MLTYAPLALIVMCLAKFDLVQAIVFTCFYTRLANHAWSSSSSGDTSSTGAVTSSTTSGTKISDVVMMPSGTAIIVSPLTIVLSLGPPKPYLCQRCDA